MEAERIMKEKGITFIGPDPDKYVREQEERKRNQLNPAGGTISKTVNNQNLNSPTTYNQTFNIKSTDPKAIVKEINNQSNVGVTLQSNHPGIRTGVMN
jgi:DNA repair protein RadC